MFENFFNSPFTVNFRHNFVITFENRREKENFSFPDKNFSLFFPHVFFAGGSSSFLHSRPPGFPVRRLPGRRRARKTGADDIPERMSAPCGAEWYAPHAAPSPGHAAKRPNTDDPFCERTGPHVPCPARRVAFPAPPGAAPPLSASLPGASALLLQRGMSFLSPPPCGSRALRRFRPAHPSAAHGRKRGKAGIMFSAVLS